MNQDRYMKMPWGKHKGFYIKDVPSEYIKWCLLNYEGQLGLLEVLKDELLRREPKLKRSIK